MGFALHPAPSTPPVVVGSLQYYRGMGCTSVSKSEKASNADLARFSLVSHLAGSGASFGRVAKAAGLAFEWRTGIQQIWNSTLHDLNM